MRIRTGIGLCWLPALQTSPMERTFQPEKTMWRKPEENSSQVERHRHSDGETERHRPTDTQKEAEMSLPTLGLFVVFFAQELDL